MAMTSVRAGEAATGTAASLGTAGVAWPAQAVAVRSSTRSAKSRDRIIASLVGQPSLRLLQAVGQRLHTRRGPQQAYVVGVAEVQRILQHVVVHPLSLPLSPCLQVLVGDVALRRAGAYD